MLLDATILELKPSERTESYEVGRSPEGHPIYRSRPLGGQEKFHDGRLMFLVSIERDGFFPHEMNTADDAARLMFEFVIRDRSSHRFFLLLSSGGWEPVNGRPESERKLIEQKPLVFLVVEAAAEEVEAAEQGRLKELRMSRRAK